MKLQVCFADLKDALGKIKKIGKIGDNHLVCFETKGDNLIIKSLYHASKDNDVLGVVLQATIPFETSDKESVEFGLMFGKLCKLIDKLPKSTTDLFITPNEYSVNFYVPNAKLKVDLEQPKRHMIEQCLQSITKNYTFNKEKQIASFTLSQPIFKNMLSKVSACVSKGGEKPALKTVYFDIESGRLTIVGCDGYRLATAFVDLTELGTNRTNFMIVRDVTSFLEKELSSKEGEVIISADNMLSQVQFDNIIITSSRVAPEYINYQQIIFARTGERIITVDTKEFAEAITNMLPFVEPHKPMVKLSCQPELIEVTNLVPSGSDIKEKVTIELSCLTNTQSEDKPFEIGFDPKYLLDMLKALNSEKTLALEFNEDIHPLKTSKHDRSGLNIGYDYIVLPFNIRNN